MIGHRKTDDFLAEQIQENGQIQPTLFGRDVSDVAGPKLIRLRHLLRRFFRLKNSLSNRQVVIGVRGLNAELFRRRPRKTVLLLEPGNPGLPALMIQASFDKDPEHEVEVFNGHSNLMDGLRDIMNPYNNTKFLIGV